MRQTMEFLSTPSARRATVLFGGLFVASLYFYPRPPRGGRLAQRNARRSTSVFLSTPSARRATERTILSAVFLCISIHALREEDDTGSAFKAAQAQKFLSTPSARRTTSSPGVFWARTAFLSTPSARRATVRNVEGPDLGSDFYPRPPRGGRREAIQLIKNVLEISIHALREEGDALQQLQDELLDISIHALREEGDPVIPCVLEHQANISIHALREEGDFSMPRFLRASGVFLSTPSARRATLTACTRPSITWHFYPRPPRGGRH